MKNFILKFVFFSFFLFTFSCDNQKTTEKSPQELSKYILVDKEGNPIPLPKDKLIVVNFLAYSCVSCMKEIPEMKKVVLMPQYRDKFQIIGIVIDSSKGDLTDPTFPIYTNHNANLVRFPVRGTPTTYIITPKGKKFVVIIGAVNEESFKKFLDEALEKYKKEKEKKN